MSTDRLSADETPVEALLTGAEWDALGRAVVPTWDNEGPATKRIWRGFARDLANGYRLGLAAGRKQALREASSKVGDLLASWPAVPTFLETDHG